MRSYCFARCTEACLSASPLILSVSISINLTLTFHDLRKQQSSLKTLEIQLKNFSSLNRQIKGKVITNHTLKTGNLKPYFGLLLRTKLGNVVQQKTTVNCKTHNSNQKLCMQKQLNECFFQSNDRLHIPSEYDCMPQHYLGTSDSLIRHTSVQNTQQKLFSLCQ